MRVDEFNNETIITAERGMFLKLVDEPDEENKFGKPERIIFSKKGNIPEFKEVPLNVETVVEEVKKEKKATKKKSTK